MPIEIKSEWVHISFPERRLYRDVYGFASQEGRVNLEGILFTPKEKPSTTLLFYMHPASTLQILPVPRAMAHAGAHVLCAGSRYARNDTALIMENVLLDIGAYMRHAREVWGYEKIVIVGWSGGGSLSAYYQSQAERPTVTETPAGDPVDISGGKLLPADAFIFQAGHVSRAEILSEFIDPSVLDENDPDKRLEDLDLYHPSRKPPYDQTFLRQFRAAQKERLRRKTAWVKETLNDLRKRGGKEVERCLITHRTMADPRWLDPFIDPNDRIPGTSFLGDPETVNTGPIGVARFSTLRSWLSQWSLEDTHCHAERNVADVSVPFLCIENTADDSVPQPHSRRVYEATASKDKEFSVIDGANHYYSGQPELLAQSVQVCLDWMRARKLLDN